MSTVHDADDLARLIALEHAFGALTLMWCCQFANQQGSLPSDAASQFRTATLGAVFDSKEHAGELGALVAAHLHRLFSDLEKMTAHADQGFANRSSR